MFRKGPSVNLDNIRILQAEWVLGRIPPEDTPMIAARLLEQGYNSDALGVIAGLSKPTYLDLKDLLDQAFAEMGMERLGERESCVAVARSIAHMIYRFELDPYEGARRMAELSLQCAESSLQAFVGLASEWEDDPANRTFYEEDIRNEAETFLRRKLT
jgi:hypothetical protein